jgi:hypothetical protein
MPWAPATTVLRNAAIQEPTYQLGINAPKHATLILASGGKERNVQGLFGPLFHG